MISLMILQAIILRAGRQPRAAPDLPLPALRFAIFERIDYVSKSIFKRLRPPIVASRADAGSVSRTFRDGAQGARELCSE
jgi:hypothetical protein